MQPFSRNAGSASALMGALQMGIGSAGTFIVSQFDNSTRHSHDRHDGCIRHPGTDHSGYSEQTHSTPDSLNILNSLSVIK